MRHSISKAGLAAWLKTRPESVQKLAAEFPIGTEVEIDGVVYMLFGYTENDTLIMTPVHSGAFAQKVYLCAAHLRKQ